MKKLLIIFAIITSLTFSLENAQAQGRTPAGSTLTTSGTRTAGIRKSTWIFSSNFAGTVLGVTYSGATDSFITIDAPPGETLGPIVYTISAGNIRLTEVR